ncbi:hypothetical protein PoB_000445800 [Plakobranchus ocellatus]|uniref:Uncharacterized protein n=1 Tax=Plakobranchus ocellatus TaxID=259542 RepID=A0AAV3Y697_9GAST|nr:hypothetical protein PoB_000445800 [Plakobranchus ocellatus]
MRTSDTPLAALDRSMVKIAWVDLATECKNRRNVEFRGIRHSYLVSTRQFSRCFVRRCVPSPSVRLELNPLQSSLQRPASTGPSNSRGVGLAITITRTNNSRLQQH